MPGRESHANTHTEPKSRPPHVPLETKRRIRVFEASTGNSFPLTNPNWESTSSHFVSSLCSSALCGNGSNGQALPRTGTYWAWFGGTEGPENGTLKQKIIIPSGASAFLGYYLKISKVYSPFNDTLGVIIDGEVLQTNP